MHRKFDNRAGIVAILMAAALLLQPLSLAGAQAATFLVTNTEDTGEGSLHQAILDANADGSATPADPHLVDATGVGGTIGLLEALPVLSQHMTIQGPGAGELTLDRWADIFRFFEINAGVTAEISGLTIVNGFSNIGGGIANSGALTLRDVTVTQCVANSGGGIANSGILSILDSALIDNFAHDLDGQGGGGILNTGTATVANTTVSENRAELHGGGIANDGEMMIGAGSVISDNEATEGNGGGILNSSGGSLTIEDSTVSGNKALSLSGGGIIGSGELVLRDSTVDGNTTAAFGGGVLASSGGTATIERSTVRDNEAISGGGGIFILGSATVAMSAVSGNKAGQSGGGIGTASGGELILTNSTVSGNETGSEVGGIAISGSAGAEIRSSTIAANDGVNLRASGTDVTVKSTLLANSLSGAENCATALDGTISSQGYNLADDGSCGFNAPGDQPVANALLAPLANNGGPTMTHALGEGSPTINKGIANGLTTDQRGLARTFNFPGVPNAPGGDGTDIGAFEVQPLPDEIFQDRFEE